MSQEKNIVILQCPRCYRVKHWNRKNEKQPGHCMCGSFQFWNVLKEEPKKVKGYVKVMSDKGYQYLKGPHFQEDPNKWIKEE